MELVHKLCTNISYTIFDDYTNCVMNKKLTDGIQILYSLHDEGYSVMDILDNYFLYIKLTNLLNDNIQLSVAEHREDNPEEWNSWLYNISEEHRIAISVKNSSGEHSAPYKLRIFKNTPLASTEELNL